MAAGDAIATTSIIISANADKMVDGLKSAENKTKGWAKNLSGSLGGDFAQELGRRGFAGGVIGGLIGGGIGGGLSEVAANTLGELGITDAINEGVKGFFGWASGATAANKAVAQLTEELKKAATEQDKMLAKGEAFREAWSFSPGD